MQRVQPKAMKFRSVCQTLTFIFNATSIAYLALVGVPKYYQTITK